MIRAVKIDDEGYFASENVRWNDVGLCQTIYLSLRKSGNGSYQCTIPEQAGAPELQVTVEAFDEILVVRHVEKRGTRWYALFPYEVEARFEIENLTVDDWDRFHGRLSLQLGAEPLPFVMSREAQNDFFNLVDDFEDEGVWVDGQFHPVGAQLSETLAPADPAFWQSRYVEFENAQAPPRWEIGAHHPALQQTFKQMKFNPSRIAVLGAGNGSDAAWLASQGHLVTAFDFAPKAINNLRERFGQLENFKVVEVDVLALPATFDSQFDIVIEHTCYCAIPPRRRSELVAAWRKLLIPSGHLIGIFFVFDQRSGPPYGSSEWEVRERLRNGFDFIYWSRWRQEEPPSRLGTELVVVAQKR